MVRSGCLLISVLVCCFTVHAQEESKSGVVKQKAQEIAQAVVKGDHAKVADFTYPKIVEAMGGREKMIAFIDMTMKSMKEKGFAIRSVKVDAPGEFLTEGENTFVVVPTVMEMTAPGGKLVGRSYLLGISSDGSKTWRFADGSGLANQEMRAKVLPKLPDKLKLPEQQKPEFVKDK
jgi:hypothetical protein